MAQLAGPLRVLFSDIDGTLVHYPKDFNNYADIVSKDEAAGRATICYREGAQVCECRLLSSLTGGDSYISQRTIELVQMIRKAGVKFVLVTGARSSTYASRRTILPEADFEVFENGGRCVRSDAVDVEWTRRFADQIGPECSELTELVPPDDFPPPEERSGTLWEQYRRMVQDGWKIDARSYMTNFRIEVKKTVGKTLEDFESTQRRQLLDAGFSTTFNLGRADVYPIASGKANCARRVLDILGEDVANSAAIFDDDNDVELGEFVARAWLPSITHKSVLEATVRNPNWKVMSFRGFLGTEEALEQVLALVVSTSSTREAGLQGVGSEKTD